MACKCKKKRKEECKEGVPAWVVTYGDMMTLLLCFFVLLAAFSELKKEDEYQRAVDAVQEAFGYVGGDGTIPVKDIPTRSMIQILEKLALQSQTKTRRSQNEIEGMAGRFTRVKRVREGLIFMIGGNSVFDPESAELKPQVREDLLTIGKLLAGRDNKIAIRGHADSKTLSPTSPWEDLDELSYARAHAVKQFLVEETGLAEQRIYLEARGDSEPLRPRAASPNDQQVNRRVEIILTEAVVEDFNSDPNFTDPSNARGG